MSLTLDSAASTQAQRAVSALQWLIEADFTVGTQYWTTWPIDTPPIDGRVYKGSGDVLSVSLIGESADSSAEKVTISCNVVNSALLAAVMADPAGYRDKPIRLYGQFFGDDYQPKGAKVHRWTGRMDKVAVPRERSPVSGGASSGRIELQCTRAGMSRARNYQGLRLTSAQHKTRFADDLGLDRVQSLIETPVPWLSVAFQRI